MEPSSPTYPGNPSLVTTTTVVRTSDLRSQDVLCGRGAPLVRYKGNISFRQLVEERRSEYMSTYRHNLKNSIACEIIGAIKARNGRFLRKIVSEEEAARLRITEPSWVPVSDAVALEKVKQAFRDLSSSSSSKKSQSKAAIQAHTSRSHHQDDKNTDTSEPNNAYRSNASPTLEEKKMPPQPQFQQRPQFRQQQEQQHQQQQQPLHQEQQKQQQQKILLAQLSLLQQQARTQPNQSIAPPSTSTHLQSMPPGLARGTSNGTNATSQSDNNELILNLLRQLSPSHLAGLLRQQQQTAGRKNQQTSSEASTSNFRSQQNPQARQPAAASDVQSLLLGQQGQRVNQAQGRLPSQDPRPFAPSSDLLARFLGGRQQELRPSQDQGTNTAANAAVLLSCLLAQKQEHRPSHDQGTVAAAAAATSALVSSLLGRQQEHQRSQDQGTTAAAAATSALLSSLLSRQQEQPRPNQEQSSEATTYNHPTRLLGRQDTGQNQQRGGPGSPLFDIEGWNRPNWPHSLEEMPSSIRQRHTQAQEEEIKFLRRIQASLVAESGLSIRAQKQEALQGGSALGQFPEQQTAMQQARQNRGFRNLPGNVESSNATASIFAALLRQAAAESQRVSAEQQVLEAASQDASLLSSLLAAPGNHASVLSNLQSSAHQHQGSIESTANIAQSLRRSAVLPGLSRLPATSSIGGPVESSGQANVTTSSSDDDGAPSSSATRSGPSNPTDTNEDTKTGSSGS